MENPIKANLNVSTILKLVVGLVLVFAILDIAGMTDYVLYPYTAVKQKFFPAAK